MSWSDPIADMLTRIRNGCKAGLPEVGMPISKFKLAIAEILQASGYIADHRIEGEGVHKQLILVLKFRGRDPVIEGLRRVSKPSCRVYVGCEDIPRVLGGLGVAIMSTSKGVMSGQDAGRERLGGEVLCYVW